MQPEFEAAEPVTDSGPIEGVNQTVYWKDCESAEWKQKEVGQWASIITTGQIKLKPGYLLYLYGGTVRQHA